MHYVVPKAFHNTEAQSQSWKQKVKKYFKDGFEEGMHRKSPKVTVMRCFFWCSSRVDCCTFMVGANCYIYIVDFYYIYGGVGYCSHGGYYIYGWFFIYGWCILSPWLYLSQAHHHHKNHRILYHIITGEKKWTTIENGLAQPRNNFASDSNPI